MNLLSSVLFGFDGSYKIFGIPVKFEKDSQRHEGGVFSTILKISTLHKLHYCHILVHEMGHAIAYKCFRMNTSVTVYTNRYNKPKDPKTQRPKGLVSLCSKSDNSKKIIRNKTATDNLFCGGFYYEYCLFYSKNSFDSSIRE